jgi:hypothetical protein
MVRSMVTVRVRTKCNTINKGNRTWGKKKRPNNNGKDEEDKNTKTTRQRKDTKTKIRRLGKRQRQ